MALRLRPPPPHALPAKAEFARGREARAAEAQRGREERQAWRDARDLAEHQVRLLDC